MWTVLAEVLGWCCAGLGAAGFALRWTDPGPQPLVVAACGGYLLRALPFVAVVLLLVARAWTGLAVAGVLAAAAVVVELPWFVGVRAPRTGLPVRVMTQNILLGRADPQALVGVVENEGVDVLLLQELTAAAQGALVAAGLERALPYRWSAPDDGAFGAGIWSRFPLHDTRDHTAVVTATLSARAALPGGVDLALVCVHPPAPWPRPPEPWRVDLAALRTLLRDVSAGPVVVAGDFNATLDHAPFRRLLIGGYRDAAAQARAGLLRTWPADRAFPPVVGIDHVLTRAAVATSVRTVRVAGTDHLGLLASVVVPR